MTEEQVQCYNCHKTSNDVEFMFQINDTEFMCTECLNKLNLIIENFVKTKGFEVSECISFNSTDECDFCKNNSMIELQLGNKKICLDCLCALYKWCEENEIGDYTTYLRNYFKFIKFINKQHEMEFSEKFFTTFGIKNYITQRALLSIEGKKAWAKNLLFIIVILSVLMLKTQKVLIADVIDVIDILFLIGALFFGYSANEMLKLNVIKNKDFLSSVQKYSGINIMLTTILLIIFTCIDYAIKNNIFNNIHDYLAYINIIPMTVLSYTLISNCYIFLKPNSLKTLILDNLIVDKMQIFKTILLYCSLFIVFLSFIIKMF